MLQETKECGRGVWNCSSSCCAAGGCIEVPADQKADACAVQNRLQSQKCATKHTILELHATGPLCGIANAQCTFELKVWLSTNPVVLVEPRTNQSSQSLWFLFEQAAFRFCIKTIARASCALFVVPERQGPFRKQSHTTTSKFERHPTNGT